MPDNDDDDDALTVAERITAIIVLVPLFLLLALAWYALMYPVLF